MSDRTQRIREAYAAFEAGQRLARWASIDNDLERAELPMMTSAERDEVDLSAGTGCVLFDSTPEAPALCPATADRPGDDLADLLVGRGCRTCD